MAERSRWWGVVVATFVVGNLASAIYHAVIGEGGPATVHTGVAAGTILLWYTVFSRRNEPESTARLEEVDSHLDHIQHSLDTIALEVERLGEGQRYAQKVLEARRAGEKEA